MAAAPPEVLRLYPDALRDSYAAAYSLLVVAPLTALASRLLLYRGKKTTSLHVYLVSFAVPMLAVWLPTWIWPEKRNVYEFLTMSRSETPYQWSQKYALFRKHFQRGALSHKDWKKVDSAYDNIYSDKARYLYDFWGPGQNMSFYETIFNVGLFYLLWVAIIYAVTTPRAAQAASKLPFVGLMALICVELSVQLTHYDPVIKEMAPFTTPREFLLWCHWYFPILVFATVSIKKVYFVDMEKHHQHVLMYMLEKNIKTVEELRHVNRELMPESATVNTSLTKIRNQL
uniref:EXPERA domain-containing protein n=1 Tax=Peronospora matthiolae TaxID=2874970 RepID=A0AAV1U4F9_9STRA